MESGPRRPERKLPEHKRFPPLQPARFFSLGFFSGEREAILNRWEMPQIG